MNYDETALNAISRKFNEGIQDVTPVTIVIISIIVLAVIFSVIVGIRSRRRTRKAAEASFQSLIRKFNLTILELDLIEKLAETLRNPLDKYHLLKNKSSYRHALKKIDALDETETKINSGLMEKLGFTKPESEPGVLSTFELSQYMPVLLRLPDGELTEAEVYSTAETNITIKCPAPPSPILPDEELMMFAPHDGDIRIFSLVPEKVRGELFSAPHAEAGEQQKLNARMKISVLKISEEKQEIFQSYIVQKSPKTMVITDKQNRLAPGDLINICLESDEKRKYGIEATVLKISEEKGLAMAELREAAAPGQQP